MIVYKLTSPDGKSYIGLTRNTLELRWQQHQYAWMRSKNQRGRKPKLFLAMDQYDPATWKVEVLFETNDYEVLGQKEDEFIRKFDTISNGYNHKGGGSKGNWKEEFSEEHRRLIAQGKKKWWDSEEGHKFKEVLRERFRNNNPGSKIAWNKGKEISEEHKEAISNGLKNYWQTPEGIRERQTTCVERAVKLGKLNKGRKWSEKRRSLPHPKLGTKQTDLQKQRAREANSLKWRVTAPDGSIREVTNLSGFCRTIGISASNVSRGGQAGWRATKI